MTDHPRPLDGVRVLDLTQVMLGPCCTQLLGDFGADIIKIEKPGYGDLSRHTLPDPAGLENPLFAGLNRNKRSVEVDLKDCDGRAVLLDLAQTCDVVVNNFRPGVMERLGLGYDDFRAVREDVIYCAATGFGSGGPYSHRGGQDAIAQAMTGVMARTTPGDGFHVYPTAMGDYSAGMHLAMGILLALIHRMRSGEGQRVEVNLHDSMLSAQMQEASMLLMRGTDLNWAARPLSGVFDTLDGAIVLIGAFRENALADVCRALDLPDLSADEAYNTQAKQFQRRPELQALVRERFAQGESDELLHRLEGEGLLCAPVRTLSEALDDEQTLANNMLVEFDHPVLGRFRTVASPIHLSRTPAEVTRPAPTLGQHTHELLRRGS